MSAGACNNSNIIEDYLKIFGVLNFEEQYFVFNLPLEEKDHQNLLNSDFTLDTGLNEYVRLKKKEIESLLFAEYSYFEENIPEELDHYTKIIEEKLSQEVSNKKVFEALIRPMWINFEVKKLFYIEKLMGNYIHKNDREKPIIISDYKSIPFNANQVKDERINRNYKQIFDLFFRS